MRVIIVLLTVATLFIGPSLKAQDERDVLTKILSEVGFSRADLGYRPTGYWNRFPLDTRHKLTSFDALFSEPLKLVDYATVMANTVEFYMDPVYADSADDGLYKLTYNLGVDKKLGGFRSYSANLLPADSTGQPLVSAFEKLIAMSERRTQYYAFGANAESLDLRSLLIDKTKDLPREVELTIAELITNLADAIRWRNLAFRNCDIEDMQKAFSIRDLADTQTDGTIFYPELDDIAADIDWGSLHYAALKVTAAAEKAERALLPIAMSVPDDFELDVSTPFGRVAILSPTYKRDKLPPPKEQSMLRAPIPGWMAFDATNTLCVIDFGRQMIYHGSPGATSSLQNPISVLIDLGGDDYYGYEQDTYPPSAGVGLLGVGVVIDSKGDDHYNGSVYAQGAGLFGVGVLLDREGNDVYKAEASAQGCGYFGIGLCFDVEGNDDFYLFGDGQGMGGIGGGVGVLASFDGDDSYRAEPLAEVADRADYHSDFKINGNNAQGAGFGRRGDGSDGHAWAGGLGAIIDIHGNDYYYSGNWSLGVGYWFATGVAIDRSGDDVYKSCYFTQGSGAHYCNGILIDEAGDDRHELYETAGAGLGFGWDYTNALLINKGGDDVYRAKMISMGLAQIRSNAFLIDIGGADKYYLGEGTPGLGEATYRTDYARPSKLTPYFTYAKSFGGFIDIGGVDAYYSFKEGEEKAHPRAKNNSLWLMPARTDSTFGADNFGVGIDIETGTIPELFKWE